MSAPGEAFVCRKGHCYHMIPKGLLWQDGEEIQEHNRFASQGCPCGERAIAILSHYGQLDDCGEMPFRGVDEVPVRILDAVDQLGNPLEAYRIVKLDRWDVSHLEELTGAFQEYPSLEPVSS